LGNEGLQLQRLLPAFYNTSVTSLDISHNGIQGQRGGEIIRDLPLRLTNMLAMPHQSVSKI
jgi:hypothetical protein